MIRVITDSASDMEAARAKEWGVEVVPLTIRFGEEVLLSGVELSNDEFYERLASGQKPATAQVNPYSFETVFRRCLEEGDDVVGIFVSQKLSGTYQSAVLAKQSIGVEAEGHIFLVDSRFVSMGMELLAIEAVRLRDVGATAGEVAERLEEMVARLHYVIILNDLDYLRAGGRLATNTTAGSRHSGVFPVVAMVDGKFENIAQARGRKGRYSWLLEKFLSDGADASSIVGFNHSHVLDDMRECMDYFAQNVDLTDTVSGEIGPTMGTHFGPKGIGLAYQKQIAKSPRKGL